MIVKEDADPLTYQCRPRELILRLHEEWNVIHEQLLSLQEEALIQLKQLDILVILIAAKGIEKLKEDALVKSS